MIAVQERCFRDRQGKVRRPFSVRAGVRARGCSGPLQEAITDFGADEPFARVTDKLQRHYGIAVSYHAARGVTLRHARAIDPLAGQPAGAPAAVLIAEMDGSLAPCVTMAEAAPDRRRTRRTEWRELKLGLARAPERADATVAVTAGGPEQAGDLWEAAARRAGLTAATRVHGLGDGAPWIAEQMALRFGRQGSYLVDFYHVCEYLAAAAPACAQDMTAAAWLERQRARLKANAVRDVLDELMPHKEPESAERQPVRQAWQYLNNRRGQLDYQGAAARGLPIGSGEVESAHRRVVQLRIKRPGAWWLLDNAAAMANLRAARLNGAWNDYWHRAA